MKKLITAEMLTTKGAMDVPGAFCEVCQDNRDIVKELKGEDLTNKDYFAPLYPQDNEDDFDVVVGVGIAILAIIKKMCTPEAWELIARQLKEDEPIIVGAYEG